MCLAAMAEEEEEEEARARSQKRKLKLKFIVCSLSNYMNWVQNWFGLWVWVNEPIT